ncbi:hypothetical protein T492DRAFT_285445 [Pavlovales sp. CCMP2436]|nr:hypothetical protein T492DRAFT_285445 [Pavlovales sp. CCMP2436]
MLRRGVASRAHAVLAAASPRAITPLAPLELAASLVDSTADNTTGEAGFLALDAVADRPGILVAEATRWWRASPRAFGGQLVAHCIVAAGSVSPFRNAHSVHVHFINASRMIRTLYTVKALREGKSFALYAVQVCKYLEIRPSPDRSPPDPSVARTLGSRDLCRAHGYRTHH